MQGQDHTPEAWVERNVAEALAGTDAGRKLAEQAGENWKRVAELVVEMSQAVSDGVDTAEQAVTNAAKTRAAVVGVHAEWVDSIKPRLRHLGRLAGGGLASCMVVLPFAPCEQVTHRTDVVTEVEVTAAEKVARDLPTCERYAVLAEVARDRGDSDAARWFGHKARTAAH